MIGQEAREGGLEGRRREVTTPGESEIVTSNTVLARSTPIGIVDTGLLLEVVALGAVMLDAGRILGSSPYHHLLRSGPDASSGLAVESQNDMHSMNAISELRNRTR